MKQQLKQRVLWQGVMMAAVSWGLLVGCGDTGPEDESGPHAEASSQEASLAAPRCSSICTATVSCDTRCDLVPGEPSTCEENGRCITGDLDADGVYFPQDNCPRAYNPTQADCDGDGLGDACENDPGVWVYKAPTLMLCHFDADMSISGVDVEIYTADVYQDISCLHLPDRYSRREVSSVHCGFHSESTCQNRVAERVTELAAQGYYPITTSDQDMCPYPRL
ncbi:hypothetical protein [Stigmatella aurantiaca]|uniref:Uncharacterized protein n=1 Tax=Stigmatella aurantiaca (strain DW4/3-1) TaxID=378806 RepID=Q099I9_STIAD|nr:hypothetical protein [Stigmatella aurantiaca]ADO75805.1 uncharacterized protein STAUR_8050 [Stigmatella aurantiaca DW4/3-1]EAU68429.1 hypothetical protein STIAU_3359 [Stigmatella aurantiaca DW4/3-1]